MPFGAQNRDGRTFIDGEDSRWTAIHGAPSTNAQVNFYNETLARTANGLLVMPASTLNTACSYDHYPIGLWPNSS